MEIWLSRPFDITSIILCVLGIFGNIVVLVFLVKKRSNNSVSNFVIALVAFENISLLTHFIICILRMNAVFGTNQSGKQLVTEKGSLTALLALIPGFWSTVTLAICVVERLLALGRSFNVNTISARNMSRTLMFCVAVVTIVYFIPAMIQRNPECDQNRACEMYAIVTAVVYIWLPFAIIITGSIAMTVGLYFRRKVKLVNMSIVRRIRLERKLRTTTLVFILTIIRIICVEPGQIYIGKNLMTSYAMGNVYDRDFIEALYFLMQIMGFSVTWFVFYFGLSSFQSFSTSLRSQFKRRNRVEAHSNRPRNGTTRTSMSPRNATCRDTASVDHSVRTITEKCVKSAKLENTVMDLDESSVWL